MSRFKAKDAVFILPKFAHLYPGNSAVVTSIRPGKFRPIFNEYGLEFPDRSTARLFEFQIIEDMPGYKTVIASLAFDDRQQTTTVQTRGGLANRRIILEAPGFDLDLRIRPANPRASIIGQLLERGTKNLLKDLEAQLMRESMPVSTAISDSDGVFKFNDVPSGSLNILIIIRRNLSRILGTLSI